ncbi:MAG: hypothetical protein IJA34_13410 [Lachnospiraceae bacterium]|nr:hypothetical protein [Lachnospiraceae bacterium]
MNEKCKKVFEEMEMLVPAADFMEIKKQRNGKLRFPIYINERIKTTDLETLELSVRSSNCLHRAGFKTIGELVEVIESSEDLRKIRNCGSKSVDEIMEQLFCFQYGQLDEGQKAKYINRVIDMNVIERRNIQ